MGPGGSYLKVREMTPRNHGRFPKEQLASAGWKMSDVLVCAKPHKFPVAKPLFELRILELFFSVMGTRP